MRRRTESVVSGGARQCYVGGVKKEEHATGDRVEKVDGGGMRIVGRTDRMVRIGTCLKALGSG